MIYLVCG
jgi:hypothetical protein